MFSAFRDRITDFVRDIFEDEAPPPVTVPSTSPSPDPAAPPSPADDAVLDPPVIDFSAYSSVFAFGDSLADAGTAADLLSTGDDLAAAVGASGLAAAIPDVTPSALGYVEGRFTNGPNWVDLINAEVTGEALSTSALDRLQGGGDLGDILELGANFALGGSVAIPDRPNDPNDLNDTRPDLQAQVDAFKGLLAIEQTTVAIETAARQIFDDWFGSDAPPPAPTPAPASDALFVVGAGGNDLFDYVDGVDFAAETPPAETAEAQAFAKAYGEAVAAATADLIDAGAGAVLIAGAPNVGAAPDVSLPFFNGDAAASVAAVQPLTDLLNAELEAKLTALARAEPEVDIFFFAPDISEPIESPAAFGLDPDRLSTPFTEAAEADPSLRADPTLDVIDEFAFIDPIHPTALGHELLFTQAAKARKLGVAPAADPAEAPADPMEAGMEAGVVNEIAPMGDAVL